jgi:VIT1/CCC1 family predicted Fe2+/Mn2+ transporter
VTTFVAFLVAGFIPLVVFVYQAAADIELTDPFLISSLATGVAFFAVGALKSRFVAQSWWRSGLETLVLGGAAASLAFIVGNLLSNLGA